MTMHSADTETDLFFARENMVYRRGLVEARETDNQLTGAEAGEEYICECNDFVEGCAENVARALNRLPKAEALLIDIVGILRTGDQAQLNQVAARVEEWMVDGV